eukprot:15103_1
MIHRAFSGSSTDPSNAQSTLHPVATVNSLATVMVTMAVAMAATVGDTAADIAVATVGREWHTNPERAGLSQSRYSLRMHTGQHWLPLPFDIYYVRMVPFNFVTLYKFISG